MSSSSDSPRPASVALGLLLALALLVTLVNAVAVGRRVPILSREADTPDERAVHTAAKWLSHYPRQYRVALLLSHRDVSAVWVSYRLNYFIYPRRPDIYWDSVPQDIASRCDVLLAMGSAAEGSSSANLPVGWSLQATDGRASLYGLAAKPQSAIAPAPPRGLLLTALCGLVGLGAVVALGALLAGRTIRLSPYSSFWANLAVAHLIGATALTVVTTVATQLLGRLEIWPVYALMIVLIPGWRLAWGWLRPNPAIRVESPTPRNSSGQRTAIWLLIGLIGIGVVTAIQRGWMLGLDWDGYSIWQLKAKAFFVDGSFSMLRDAAHFEYAHRDYPLLVPLQTWWVYAHIGAPSDHWAQLINLLFYFDLLILFAASIRRYLPLIPTLFGVGLLAPLPVVTHMAMSGFADIPFAAFLLALGVSIGRVISESDRSQIALAAWMLAGVALVKNEGLLAGFSALTVLVVYAVYAIKARGAVQRRTLIRALVIGCGGIAIAYLPWLLQKRAWRLTTDLFAREAEKPEQSVIWRFGYTLKSWLLTLGHVGPWYPCWGLLIVLLPIGFALSIRNRVAAAGPFWLLALLQLAGYTAIYLMTPHDLRWHVTTSMNRLWVHVAPIALLATLMGFYASPRRMAESD